MPETNAELETEIEEVAESEQVQWSLTQELYQDLKARQQRIENQLTELSALMQPPVPVPTLESDQPILETESETLVIQNPENVEGEKPKKKSRGRRLSLKRRR